MAKKKFYAVAVGSNPGIYTAWAEAESQVKGYKGARYKSFGTRSEAEAWIAEGGEYSGDRKKTAKPNTPQTVQAAPPAGEVYLFTDGGSINNPGPGGWGAVILDGNEEREYSGGFRLTTNNRMELMACICGLEKLKNDSRQITLFSDSSYVVNGMEKGWAKSWQRKNWCKSDGEPAKNSDLWELLLALTAPLKISFKWVKGHDGNVYNERCDQLAVAAAKADPNDVDHLYEQKKQA